MENKNRNDKGGLKHRAYRFALQIVVLVDTLDKRDFVVVVIVKQLLRCATSIGANIIEAQAGGSRKDFANFFSYALKSANETKFWLDLLRDSGKASRESVVPLLPEAHELANILASSIIKAVLTPGQAPVLRNSLRSYFARQSRAVLNPYISSSLGRHAN